MFNEEWVRIGEYISICVDPLIENNLGLTVCRFLLVCDQNYYFIVTALMTWKMGRNDNFYKALLNCGYIKLFFFNAKK